MIPRECRRLAEVDFPIAVVSRHAAREKSIRHGHPSTLHLWWARRPLASSRAVLLALLLPDPADPACPAKFRRAAKRQIRELAEHLVRTKSGSALLTADLKSDLGSPKPDRRLKAEREAERRAKFWAGIAETRRWTLLQLRSTLLNLLAQGSAWKWSDAEPALTVCRNLVKAAHGEEPPLVVDPFAGGGSIPLEALRLGCEAFASDLNPVACLILKVMLEEIPRRGPGLADELRRVGGEIKAAAEKELAGLYPPDPDGATPIAYLWARTVRCEAPRCGAEIPLLRSFWLAKKQVFKRENGRRVKIRGRQALRCRVVRPAKGPPRADLEVFEPTTDKDVPSGTVTRAKAACPCCHVVLPPERVRAQLADQRGGADAVFDERGKRIGGARLTAVVTLKEDEPGRRYRSPTDADYAAVHAAHARLTDMLGEWERGGKQGLCPVPDEPLPPIGTLGFRVQRYGMFQWGDLFTARQKVALAALTALTRLSPASASPADGAAKQPLVSPTTLLTLALTRTANAGCSLCRWHTSGEKHEGVYSRQALPIVWDYSECNPLSESTGGYGGALDWVYHVIESSPQSNPGQVQSADSAAHPLPDQAAGVWFTDPPYYDAIPYSDLSDFFLVWLKRALPGHPLLRDPFDPDNPLSPKTREVVQDETKTCGGRVKDRAFFEETMGRACAEGRRVLREDGIGSVVFAHKTTEGWEALLAGLIRGGWTITGSWPIATEMGSRLRARDSAALATSVHLICRPRPADAPVGDWADMLRELPPRVGEWMERLQGEGVRGADLVFACIGPALEIFSRYPSVETPDGREVGLTEYLERVWEVVGRTALENILGAAEARARNGLAGALEEDARLTALFLWTLQATNADAGDDDSVAGDAPAADEDDGDADDAAGGKVPGFALVFDVVRRFAQPLGIDLPKWEKRTIETTKGVVRLLPVGERARYLFGEQGAQAVATRLEHEATFGPDPLQGLLFPDRPESAPIAVRERRPRYGDEAVRERPRTGDPDDPAADRSAAPDRDTTLDQVHRAMLLQRGGLTGALHALLKTEHERGPDFLRLSNALSALYPRGSEEKRLLDAMLLAAPR